MVERRRVDLVCREPSPAAEALALLVSQLGGSPRLVSPAAVGADPTRAAAIVLDGVDRRVLRALRPAPAMVVAADGSALRTIAAHCGLELRGAGRAPCRAYEFATSEPALWPFAGVMVEEAADRELETLAGPALRPLITAGGRPVVAALPDHDLVVTTVVPWADGPPPYLLRRSLAPDRFLDALPALILARRALAEQAWHRPRAQAVTIVDDPNLVRLSYGYLDYRQAARLAADHDFHLSIGFVPLDFARTDPAVGRFFAEHADRLSLVMHGNDHRKRELARVVPDQQAAFRMRQALARMRRHQELTGLHWDPVMTMPHGAYEPHWAQALRDAGYTAAIVGRAYAFTDDPEAAGAGRLHELLPADTSLYGLPLITRWPLEHSPLGVLFGAFAGKPACVYTHHQYFAGGWGRFLDVVSFLNRQVGPQWASAGDVARGNHLVRRSGSTFQVRAYSNDLGVDVPDWAERVEVEKLGAGIPWHTERMLVDGRPVEESERSEGRIAGTLAPPDRRRLRVRFVSTLAGEPGPGWERAMLLSRARRMLTETRDRVRAVLA